MIIPGRKNQQELCERAHFLMQQEIADTLGKFAATRLAAYQHRLALLSQILRQCLKMRALARTIDSLKCDETVLHISTMMKVGR
jgi:hypothetical protein